MVGRRLFLVAATLVIVVSAYSANSAEKASWNGVWIGDFGNRSRIAITVAHGRVTRYSYRGQPIDVSYDKLGDGGLSFGDNDNYTMSLMRTGDSTAKATYHGRHGFASAAMERQPALASSSPH